MALGGGRVRGRAAGDPCVINPICTVGNWSLIALGDSGAIVVHSLKFIPEKGREWRSSYTSSSY